jgi:hypothetical protein
LQVQEGIHAETEGCVPVGGPASADDPGPHVVGELYGDGPDTACGAVDQDSLPCHEAGVVEQALPGGQPGDRQRGGHGVVDVRREWGEVAGLHRAVLGEGAVAGPVGQSEHPLADGQAGGAVAQLDDDTGQLVAGHARRPVAVGAVGPCCRPVRLSRGEPRGMHLHDDVVLGGVGVGNFRQGESADVGVTVSNSDGLHGSFLCAEDVRILPIW